MTESPAVRGDGAGDEGAVGAGAVGAGTVGTVGAGDTEAAAGAAGAADAAVAQDSPRSSQEVVGVEQLRFNADGLICAVAQQFDTREVLMVAWMDAEAVRRTLATGAATYFSRSRQAYWVKGETSGHTQRVIEVRHDCDADALLVLVDQTGPACHTGTRSCFEDRVLAALAVKDG